ncbi:MAG: hypothetical protein HY648_03100 [Acidobacteria bacterium]|nr:hypothetical protein [Acidobacteriota bacterium]
MDLTGDIVVISFDPYMFDCHGPGRSPEPSRMYPCDLRILEKAIKPITKGIIVQLSTYSANNNNPQQIVTEVVDACLKTTGLETACLVKADGNMMSIVLVRDIAWTGALCSLETRFRSWLEDIKNKVGAKVHM